MPSLKDHLANVRAQVREVGLDDARGTLLDVREPDEQVAGTIPGALCIPRGLLELRIESAVPRDAELVVYCQSGTRSVLAAHTLSELGYPNVRSLAGGFDAWRAAGRPIERPALSRSQHERYARHTRLPDVGDAGQAKLLSAKVLLVGAGGLGSPAALYLAAAGVGTLGIVDDDTVDVSNLQRQILHTTDDVGTPKVESAARAIAALNPDVRVVQHAVRLTAENARALLDGYDVIVDGSDSLVTRYVINGAALALRKPVVHASIYQLEGQVTVFRSPDGPCYRCLHPEPPVEGLAPSCAEAGVLGVLPGVLGTIQATETLKLLLGIGTPLVGRVLCYDALAMRFSSIALARDPHCPACKSPQP